VMPIDSSAIPKIDRLVRLLSSPVDGERLGAVHALERVLKAAGASFHDLADRIVNVPQAGRQSRQEPPPRDELWPINQALAKRLLDAYQGPLTPWGCEFLTSIVGWRGGLRPKQRSTLEGIHRRAREWGWRP
jgi:hypothetical protein